MKKYLSIVIAAVVLLSVGSVSAVVFQVSILQPSNTPLIMDTLSGGCGGHGGCHNNTNMTELTGELTYEDSTFMIETTILNFGCYYYINTTTSPYDFDGDGELETILNELLGMVGTTITVEGYLRCHHSKLMVYYINGIAYRECMMTVCYVT